MRKQNVNEWEIAILGAGTMGLCIAQFFAMNGHTVFLYNRTASNLEKALIQIQNNLNMLAAIDQIPHTSIPSILANIHGTGDLKEAVIHADFIVENVAEREELKKEIFAKLDQFCDKDIIFSSDTSTMNIYDFLEISHPERLIITHFFNPAYVMPLVEIVRGPQTSDEIVTLTKTLLESCGKKTALLNKAIPGFILNRITMAIFREASYIAENGWATPEDIDKAITSTFGPRYTFEGPFALSDFAGIDVYERLGTLLPPVLNPSTDCPPSLKELVKNSKLGVKSKEGYYTYPDPVQAKKIRDSKIIKMIKVIEEVNMDIK